MLTGVTSVVYTTHMERIDPADLVDAAGVAEILGLANRTSISVYQRRYPDMPRPVVDLGPQRTKLWSKNAVESWAESADRRSPAAIMSSELADMVLQGNPLAQGIFRSTYSGYRQNALGGGKNSRQIGPSRRESYEPAFKQAEQVDPSFSVTMPDGWLDEA